MCDIISKKLFWTSEPQCKQISISNWIHSTRSVWVPIVPRFHVREIKLCRIGFFEWVTTTCIMIFSLYRTSVYFSEPFDRTMYLLNGEMFLWHEWTFFVSTRVSSACRYNEYVREVDLLPHYELLVPKQCRKITILLLLISCLWISFDTQRLRRSN